MLMKNIHLILLALITASSANADDAVCDISPIPESLNEHGCGCSYSINHKYHSRPYFQSEEDFTSPTMYINGKLVTVKPIKLEGISANSKIGDKFSQSFEYAGITIEFENAISFVCPANTEGGCEVTSFNSIMRVSGKQCTAKPISIKGDCGC